MTTKTFTNIDADELNSVTGGGTRGSSGNNAQLQTMLSSITDSIKDVANSKSSSSSDQMMPMMMMMMMMGGGGSSSAAAAAPPPPPPPPATVVKVNVRR